MSNIGCRENENGRGVSGNSDKSHIPLINPNSLKIITDNPAELSEKPQNLTTATL